MFPLMSSTDHELQHNSSIKAALPSLTKKRESQQRPERVFLSGRFLARSTPLLLVALFGGCSSADPGTNPQGTGGATTTGGSSSGGSTASGGNAAVGGQTTSGGQGTTGGTTAAGGTAGTGGSEPASGGADGTGGETTETGGATGSGGSQLGDGGTTASGGTAGTGGTTATGGTAGTGGAGSCMIGQTQGSEVAVIGESFIAATHEITQRIETLAREQGSLASGDNYIDNSVSGTTLANDQIPSQYDQAVQSSDHIKYVLMDGGGNDCLLNNNGDAALAAAEELFETMAQNNTEKVVYFFYPDPIGSQFSSLKTCLDDLRPKMKALCDGLTAPKCYWLDLRDVWDGHPEYTDDGIHPTTAGSHASGDAIWEVMKENCVAQ